MSHRSRIFAQRRWLAAVLAVAVLSLGAPLVVHAEVTPVTVVTTSLPDAQANVAYTQTLVGGNGSTPYHWTIIAGALPGGLHLDATTGTISGTPTASGYGAFTVQITDAGDVTAVQSLTIHVTAATSPSSSSTVDVVCASDLSAKPELAALCTIYANPRLPDWAHSTLARVIVRLAGHAHRDGTVVGQVAAVSGATISVTTHKGTVSVVTNDSTTFTHDGNAATLADVMAGDRIAATGTRNDDGSLLATAIRLASPKPDSARVTGTITAISGATLTVSERGKHGDHEDDTDTPTAVTVITTATTEFTKGGETIALADLVVGDKIAAIGTRGDGDALVATAVKVRGHHEADEEHDEDQGQGLRGRIGIGLALGHHAKAEHGGRSLFTTGLGLGIGEHEQD